MDFLLTNTLTRRKERFEPGDPNRITVYVCGPTVYDYAHIGNARPAVVFDVLLRILRRLYGREAVIYARNLTDVDDKIIARAAEAGKSPDDIARTFAAAYREDMAALGVEPPTIEPTATAHIGEMIALIETLAAKGHAYATAQGAWFHVPSMADYGRLSGRTLEEMRAGARVEVTEEKRDPADFALWKAAKPGEPAWDSPWGPGRPGWHIECSAMIAAALGESIDIHGGGHDLIFPHHENEIAQSQCATGAPLARFWLHNGFLTMDAEKMSKSLGNVQTVRGLLERWDGETLRFALLSAHYRAPLDWTEQLLTQTKASLDRLYGALERLADAPAPQEPAPTQEGVLSALLDDLNTPKALSALFALASAANKAESPEQRAEAKAALLAGGALMGLLQQDPETRARGGGGADPFEIDRLVEARAAARAAKNWAEADRLRNHLDALGVEVMDGAGGSRWKWR